MSDELEIEETEETEETEERPYAYKVMVLVDLMVQRPWEDLEAERFGFEELHGRAPSDDECFYSSELDSRVMWVRVQSNNPEVVASPGWQEQIELSVKEALGLNESDEACDPMRVGLVLDHPTQDLDGAKLRLVRLSIITGSIETLER